MSWTTVRRKKKPACKKFCIFLPSNVYGNVHVWFTACFLHPSLSYWQRYMSRVNYFWGGGGDDARGLMWPIVCSCLGAGWRIANLLAECWRFSLGAVPRLGHRTDHSMRKPICSIGVFPQESDGDIFSFLRRALDENLKYAAFCVHGT